MVHVVRLEQVNSQSLAVVHRRAGIQELPKVVPDTCGIVWSVIRAQRVQGAGRHIAVYLDDQINLEVGVELDVLFACYAAHGEIGKRPMDQFAQGIRKYRKGLKSRRTKALQ